jgi:hypothetical protein
MVHISYLHSLYVEQHLRDMFPLFGSRVFPGLSSSRCALCLGRLFRALGARFRLVFALLCPLFPIVEPVWSINLPHIWHAVSEGKFNIADGVALYEISCGDEFSEVVQRGKCELWHLGRKECGFGVDGAARGE